MEQEGKRMKFIELLATVCCALIAVFGTAFIVALLRAGILFLW